MPGREFKLADDGEILVRGENVSAGYWQAGGVQSSDDRAWLPTGDVGELDAEGNLRFRGRKKNIIVTPAGLNVYPEDLEHALRNQPNVKDCVVIPMNRGGNAEPCAVLLVDDGSRDGAVSADHAGNASDPQSTRTNQRSTLSKTRTPPLRNINACAHGLSGPTPISWHADYCSCAGCNQWLPQLKF